MQVDIQEYDVILEPFGKNTAPAISLAAMYALNRLDADPILLVLPSDHVIEDLKEFHRLLDLACECASKNMLVTFGVLPDSPKTGFGYIKPAEKLDGICAYQVDQFVEKPNSTLAKEYVDSGYYWNSGMFMFKASVFLENLGMYATDIFDLCETIESSSVSDHGFLHLSEDLFRKCRSESIDYAVMEKAQNTVVVPLNAGWSDIGSWDSLWTHKQSDEKNNNVAIGNVVLEKSKDVYVHATDNKRIIVLGMRDCIVVETEEEVLVLHKDFSQDLKSVVSKLSNKSDEKL